MILQRLRHALARPWRSAAAAPRPAGRRRLAAGPCAAPAAGRRRSGAARPGDDRPLPLQSLRRAQRRGARRAPSRATVVHPLRLQRALSGDGAPAGHRAPGRPRGARRPAAATRDRRHRPVRRRELRAAAGALLRLREHLVPHRAAARHRQRRSGRSPAATTSSSPATCSSTSCRRSARAFANAPDAAEARRRVRVQRPVLAGRRHRRALPGALRLPRGRGGWPLDGCAT